MAQQSKSTMASSLKVQHEIRREQLTGQQREEDGYAARMKSALEKMG